MVARDFPSYDSTPRWVGIEARVFLKEGSEQIVTLVTCCDMRCNFTCSSEINLTSSCGTRLSVPSSHRLVRRGNREQLITSEVLLSPGDVLCLGEGKFFKVSPTCREGDLGIVIHSFLCTGEKVYGFDDQSHDKRLV